MKQKSLAFELGISQQTMSRLEQNEEIEKEVLEKIAKALGVTTEAIKIFSEDTIFHIISNTFTSNDNSKLNAVNLQPTFNPLDRVAELHEGLLQAEREKNALLEQLLKGKQ